ncbi:sensor histidine kinase [Zavarzinella formosa]|uniref:sensor histidine kinase n=1 Tax=Zavarzinella formosa TaxID=360055 RepID=UPI00138ACBAF|nr:ATP-binding protein [Zavarzinella formosa]
MVKSIRLRLLIWYAAVLTGVVGGFAVLLYYEVRAARLAELDAHLESTAAGLEASLRLFPPHEFNGEPPPAPPPKKQPPPKKGEGPPPKKNEFPKWNDPQSPKWNDPPDGPNRERLLNSLNLPGPPRQAGEGTPTYFAVWRPNGTLIKGSDLPPGEEVMPSVAGEAVTYFRGPYRERLGRGPNASTILVGRDSGNVPAELTAFIWRLIGTGAVVLAVGLLGGWLISRRILRPISAIAATASRISGVSLTERIDTSNVDTELAELADVLNEAFDRLQGAFDRQARFTADASHELRTPLAVIKSQAELTLSRARTPEEYRLAIEACLRAATRMTDLVERLLLLARADAGLPGGTRSPVALERVVAEVIAQLKPLAVEKEVTLTTDFVPVPVSADAVALAQVAGNLIANAIQYNKPGGQVRVKVKLDGTDAVLSVKDSGPGIGPEDRRRIFERFYRVDKARTRSTGGTGLGLAICKSIVEAHGGTISCESTLGKGSTFRVRLPRKKMEKAAKAEEHD